MPFLSGPDQGAGCLCARLEDQEGASRIGFILEEAGEIGFGRRGGGREDVYSDLSQKWYALTSACAAASRPLAFHVANCLKDRAPPWPSIGYVIEIPPDPSDDDFAFISKCIKGCQENHSDTCGSSSTPTDEAPARLLRISPDKKTVKLIVQSSKNLEPYVALSHCWGNDLPLTTTQDNIRSLQRGFKVATLPPLYQDAVSIAHRVGVSHVWIDSLSIVQDAHEDWTRESAKMASIYSNAVFTIAAIDAKDSSKRILAPRPKPIRVTYKNTKGEEHHLKARLLADHFPNRTERLPAPLNGPLSRRAWTLQEHVLSTRVFQFTATEIIFECRSAFACECAPGLKESWPTAPGLLGQLAGTKSKRKLHGAWHRLVEKYTLRRLTQPTDKLPALSGLAHRFHELVRSRYCAGLWAGNLLEDMLWSSAPWLRSPSDVVPPAQYRAPSFSWASVDTQVRFEHVASSEEADGISQVARIVGFEIDNNELDPFGQVVDGSWLRIRGPVQACLLTAPAKEDLDFYLKLELSSGPGSRIDVFPDCILTAHGPRGSGDEASEARRATFGEEYTAFSATAYCVGISVDSSKGGIITGLVVGKSPRGNISSNHDDMFDGAYERLGLFSCGLESFGPLKETEIMIL
jgi:hypothetical protein